MALALVLGMVVAVIRYLRIPVLSGLFTFYVLFVRGTPLLVQAYAAFFILPSYGITLSAFVTGVIVIGDQLQRLHRRGLPLRHRRLAHRAVGGGHRAELAGASHLDQDRAAAGGQEHHPGARQLLDPDVQGLCHPRRHHLTPS
ncbi:MAG: ABC transporter permease subunit [Nocardioidaceae bacterium]